ncbi:unnamed protein product [Rotaria sp. Silwood2]|nr:unnamed protein product [Rotaria sp. Silwood2]CAF4478020.1 unnamed protein product [Rotaria sp. Silwood2]CAF4502738.1 unnamed protein product [Rotaria sp. Silwood2]
MFKRPQVNISSLTMNGDILLNLIPTMSDLDVFLELSNSLIRSTMNQDNPICNNKFPIDNFNICRRDIKIYVEILMTIRCLCHRRIFGIVITLIDQDNVIHDYEQITYKTIHKCENKYFNYLLYKSRSKDI